MKREKSRQASRDHRIFPRPSFNEVRAWRHADWVYRRAWELYENAGQPWRGEDSEWTISTWQLLKKRASNPRPPMTPRQHAIEAAWAIFRGDIFFREVLEARILTGDPLRRIAELSKLAEPIVQAYVQVFYDVLTRLSGAGWIVAKAIGSPRTLQEPPTLGMVLRRFGYFAGSQALEAVLAAVLTLRPSSCVEASVSISEQTHWKIQRVLATEFLPMDCRNAVLMRMHELHYASARRESPAAVEAIERDWSNHVRLDFKDDKIEVAINSDWMPLCVAAA